MPEPADKLDAEANGPKGLPASFTGEDWEKMTQSQWRWHEEQVRRLRHRIFKAVREQDWAKARNLQKLMLRSWSNTLVSVRIVTQRNKGRRTAGIDGVVALTSAQRAAMAVRVHAGRGSWDPLPVRRGRSQPVVAIQAGGSSLSWRRSSANTSLGFLNPSIARGRSLSSSAMAHR